MQDRYAGDIGDFVKLGLLRAISEGRRLGIAWYRFPDESHNSDGRHISYLSKPQIYSSLDPELFRHLQTVVAGTRTIESLLGVLPGAASSDALLDLASVPVRERRQWRYDWFARVQSDLKECDIVFADPDNGIVDDDDHRKGRARFGKQIPLEEVKSLARGRCAIVYHHNTRKKGGHDREVEDWLRTFRVRSIAVRAKKYSPRTFFIINPNKYIEERVGKFCERWSKLQVSLHES